MTKRSQSIIRDKLPSAAAVIAILIVWQTVCSLSLVPKYMLPSPAEIIMAFISDRQLLFENSIITLKEAFAGIILGLLTGVTAAILMDASDFFYKVFYPVMVLTQTVPTVAIAPLLVLWFGYEMLPKILLIVITTFFPVAVGMLDGFRSADKDTISLLRSMGASRTQIFRYLKFPNALPQLFSAIRITVTYSVIGAVISEWLGGFGGLGVYMTRVKKAFAFDKMFAVIFLISAISLLLTALINTAEKKFLPYKKTTTDRSDLS